jgi:ABC-type Zn uptake system ZnuABC Zn-binding protein ZnuA
VKLLLPVAALFLAVCLAACSSGNGNNARLKVVATTTQIGDMTANVGGDAISLTILLRGNQDAHDFAPKPSDFRAMASASLILRNGLHLDSYADKAISGSNATVAVVTDGIDLLQASADEEQEAAKSQDSDNRDGDPHVWHSVPNAKIMVTNIRDALIAADPAHADTYRQNADTYLSQLDSLDSEIRARVGEIPPACRKLVTDHDAFGYFAKEYGLQIIGAVIPSTTTEAQASASDIADLVNLIRQEKVAAIFSEQSVNPALSQQVAREANVKIIDTLYGDSLGAKGSNGDTYIKMMQANATTIADALKDCGP